MFATLRQYSLPLLLALALHGIAALALARGFSPDPSAPKIVKPQIVRSELIVLEPESKPAPPSKPAATPPPKSQPKPVVQPPPKPEPKPEPKPKPQPEPEPEPVEPQPDPELERQRAEQEARKQRLDELATAQFEEALAAESAETADAQAEATASAAEATAQSFRAGIHQAIVANWSRPPSARRDMAALLLVELVPIGDVVAVTVIESSGNAAFDRSAEAAVRKVRRFVVPEESAVFERYFRKFQLQFKPEDLMR